MSKLILDYYLTLIRPNAGPNAFRSISAAYLLYNDDIPAQIEGGGRVLVATRNGSFVIPADAGEGLIYIGLDDQYKPVTGLIWH